MGFFNRFFSRKESTFSTKYKVGDTVFAYNNCRSEDKFVIDVIIIHKIEATCYTKGGYPRMSVFYSEDIPVNSVYIHGINERYVHHDRNELLKVLVEDGKYIAHKTNE